MSVNPFGAIFGIGTGGQSPTYTPVAQVYRITPPSRSREAIETTNFDSSAKNAEFIAGAVKTMQPFTVELNWTTGAETALLAAFEAGSGSFRVTLPNGGPVYTYSAIFTAFEPGPLEDDKRIISCTFQPTGAEVIS